MAISATVSTTILVGRQPVLWSRCTGLVIFYFRWGICVFLHTAQFINYNPNKIKLIKLRIKILPSAAEPCVSKSPQRNCIFGAAPAERMIALEKMQRVCKEIIVE